MGTDALYYKNGASIAGATGLASKARQSMYRVFKDKMRPSERTKILDVGVSDSVMEFSNMLEHLHPWPRQITAAGLSEGTEFRRTHPTVSYVQIEAGKGLPFADKEFDIGYSNAVLEHVGGAASRRLFLSELSRVSERLFIAVPNRWFPVEHHTSIPLLHWWPDAFRFLCRNSKRWEFWATLENLDFLDERAISEVWPTPSLKFLHSGLPLGPLSSNLIAIG